MRARTQTEDVIRHLEEFGHITSWQAIKEYGATRLSAIIHNLRHKRGMNIVSEDTLVKNRYGRKVPIAKYKLVRKAQQTLF